MHLDPVLLSRLQFAFVVSFHIIFPSFTIGLAAWLTTIEGMRLASGFTSVLWPTRIVTGKIVILGLDSASAGQ